eukprot:366227-Chlamydomonas_euryale.AAC.36
MEAGCTDKRMDAAVGLPVSKRQCEAVIARPHLCLYLRLRKAAALPLPVCSIGISLLDHAP